ncbi:hypothetical protein KIN20_016079 [Parelaphostrongylus tenuis]|uniref:Uncharacterized protein n=1 Tax=Parelaphostrongylus tenuis TaxID=148309 RepID=A0AAD5MGY9_PARTN|nr:hypothetical protein KIN20_016079 [Parelaphostrongylus tenuis]
MTPLPTRCCSSRYADDPGASVCSPDGMCPSSWDVIKVKDHAIFFVGPPTQDDGSNFKRRWIVRH